MSVSLQVENNIRFPKVDNTLAKELAKEIVEGMKGSLIMQQLYYNLTGPRNAQLDKLVESIVK